jgi:hypothetical protein
VARFSRSLCCATATGSLSQQAERLVATVGIFRLRNG